MSAETRRYRNIDKYHQYMQRKKTNYRKNSGSGMGRIPWTKEHALMAIARDMSDREIANLTGHSIEAVQAKRRRLRKGLEYIKEYNPLTDPHNPYNQREEESHGNFNERGYKTN